MAFIEVYVEAPLEVLVERDVKGLYRKALAGEIEHFTGVSDPYEPPTSPDVVVHSDRERVDESVARIVQVLLDRGLVTASADRGGVVMETLPLSRVPEARRPTRAGRRRRPGRHLEDRGASLAAGADVTVVAPEMTTGIEASSGDPRAARVPSRPISTARGWSWRPPRRRSTARSPRPRRRAACS